MTDPETDAQTGEVTCSEAHTAASKWPSQDVWVQACSHEQGRRSALHGGCGFPPLPGPAPEDDAGCLGLSSC